METTPNNFLDDPNEQDNFIEMNFMTFNFPFNENETPSDTLFDLSTHSSINHHSDQFNQHFGTDFGPLMRLPKQKPFKISKILEFTPSLTLLFSQAFNKRK